MTTAAYTSRHLYAGYDALPEADRCPACPECPGLLIQQDAWNFNIKHSCGMCLGDGIAAGARGRLGIPRTGARCPLPAGHPGLWYTQKPAPVERATFKARVRRLLGRG